MKRRGGDRASTEIDRPTDCAHVSTRTRSELENERRTFGGVPKILDSLPSIHSTQLGRVLGSSSYMDAEMWKVSQVKIE